MLGIDRSYMSRIETAKKYPSLLVLKTLADGFGLSQSQLLRSRVADSTPGIHKNVNYSYGMISTQIAG
jgi:transcriptional regulator with XRE-family HTH domain